MQIDVQIVPQGSNPADLGTKKVVVLDILRATSTIVTALGNSAFEVIPVAEPGEVIELARRIGGAECITGGERKGYRVEGFDLGNSPLEYTEEVVKGKKVILSTTNGTQAIKTAQGAEELLIGSYLNLGVLVEYLKDVERDLLIFCSGREGRASLEDLACAGWIILELQQRRSDIIMTDSAVIATYVGEKSQAIGLDAFLRQTDHGRYLDSIEMGRDIEACAAVNRFPVLPRFREGKISIQ